MLRKLLMLIAIVGALAFFASPSVSAPAGKVNMCHKGHVVSISGNAVSTHERHGDCVDEADVQPGDPCKCEDDDSSEEENP